MLLAMEPEKNKLLIFVFQRDTLCIPIINAT